jgi:DHA1 family tetracycline resistance protein-like MFS transporter
MTGQRGLAVLLSTVFVDQLGWGIVVPFLPLYARSMGASGFEVGLLLAVYSLAQMIVSPWWGRLSDRIGRRPLVIIGAAGCCVGFVALGLADALIVVFVARAWLGSFGIGMATAQAWVADNVPGADRGRTMALISAASAFGFTLGPALGALGVATGGLAVPFWVAAGLAAANTLLAALVLPRTPPVARAAARARFRDVATGRTFAVCLVVSFVLTYAFSNIEATFALFTRDALAFSVADNGWCFALLGLTGTATTALGTRALARRMSEERRVVLGLVVLALGAATIPVAQTWLQLCAPLVLLAVGFGITTPSLAAWVSKSARPERQGEALGIAQAVSAMSRVVGPGAGGLMFDRVSRESPFWTAGALIGLTALATWVAARKAAS